MIETLYRIENLRTGAGMWYREDGTFDPFIYRLTEGASKSLPMEFDERYHDGGVNWQSATSSKSDLRLWFSARDALELAQNGYQLYELQAREYKIEERQTLFTRRGIVRRAAIPLSEVWGREIGRWASS